MPKITIADSADVITTEAVNQLSDTIDRMAEAGFFPTTIVLDTSVSAESAAKQVDINVDAVAKEIELTITYGAAPVP